MAMLGEQPLPVTAAAVAAVTAAPGAVGSAGVPTTATTVDGGASVLAAVAVAAVGSCRPQVAEADRKHLQSLLNNNFVRGTTQVRLCVCEYKCFL